MSKKACTLKVSLLSWVFSMSFLALAESPLPSSISEQQNIRPCVVSYADTLELSTQAIDAIRKYEKQMNLIEPDGNSLSEAERIQAARMWAPEDFNPKLRALFEHVFSEVRCIEMPALVRDLMMDADPKKTIFQPKAWKKLLEILNITQWNLRWEKKLREAHLDYGNPNAIDAFKFLELQRASTWLGFFRINESDEVFSKLDGFPKDPKKREELFNFRKKVKESFNLLLEEALPKTQGFFWTFHLRKFSEEIPKPCPFNFHGIFATNVTVFDQNKNLISSPHRLSLLQFGCYAVLIIKNPLGPQASSEQSTVEIFQFTGKRYRVRWDQEESRITAFSQAAPQSFSKTIFNEQGKQLMTSTFTFDATDASALLVKKSFDPASTPWIFRYHRDLQEEARLREGTQPKRQTQ